MSGMPRSLCLALAALAVSACAGPPPTQGETAGKVRNAVDAAGLASRALELVGLMPHYACGESRRELAGRAAEHLRAALPCAVVADYPVGEDADQMVVLFPVEACPLRGKQLSGRLLFTYAGGDDTFSAQADLRELAIDGEAIPVVAGVRSCGDETTYFAKAEGRLAKDVAFSLDLSAAVRQGPPLIGATDLVVTGTAELDSPGGVDKVAFEGLAYELGGLVPHDGALEIDTSSGHSVRAQFESKAWHLGEAQVTVDQGEPVKVPIAH